MMVAKVKFGCDLYRNMLVSSVKIYMYVYIYIHTHTCVNGHVSDVYE